MIQHSFSAVTTAVSQDQLWRLMSDVNNWKTWDKSVAYSHLDGSFTAGNHFLLKPQGGPQVKILLEEVRPGEYFRDLTVFPLAKMYGEHWYENTPQGLKVTIKMTMKGLLSPLWNKIVMKGIVTGLPEDIKTQISSAGKLSA